MLDDEWRGLIYRFYEVYPKGHPRAGRRRFKQCDISVRKGVAKTEVAAPTSTLTVTALSSTTALTSIIKAWTSSRDPSAYHASIPGMNRDLSDTYVFFTAATWSQDGVQSGTRAFTRSSSSNNFIGFLLEIGLA